MSRARHEIPIARWLQWGVRRQQVFVEVGFLAGQTEAQPFGEDFVVTVTERTVRNFAAHDLA
jgi:hypothetical protein